MAVKTECMSVYLFFFLIRHYDIIAIFCLLHYSFLSFIKINVWHSIEQRIINDASIDQWHSAAFTTQNMHILPKADILNT